MILIQGSRGRLMSLLSIYWRTLGLLGGDIKLAVLLALANIALAAAQFAEPVLFGRVIDRLSAANAGSPPPSFLDLAPLLGAWAGFGLFSILAGVLVALHADRLAHQRRLAVMALFFEHVRTFPRAFTARFIQAACSR